MYNLKRDLLILLQVCLPMIGTMAILTIAIDFICRRL